MKSVFENNDKKNVRPTRLFIKGDVLDKFNSLISSLYFLIFCVSIIIIGIYILLKIPLEGEFTDFLIYILSPFLILFGLYGIYRVWHNSSLIKISTGFSKSKNSKLLIEFLKLRKYTIVSQTEDSILVVEEESMSYNGLWVKEIRFLIYDDEILFNIQKLYPKLNPPIFLTHLFLKYDLKRFFTKQR